MNDVSVIDRFLAVFSLYIDSGFGLLGGEVAFLTLTLVAIDMTLAGLFWAMGGEDVSAKLIRKTLYVGAFAFIIGNFNALAEIVFRSFAGLGLLASGFALSQGEFLQPGRLASIGIDAGNPLLEHISRMSGFPEVFSNLHSIVVLLLAWLVVVVSFFFLAIQLFVTLIEFKLTTLAGFVLVPFALWNKTAFLAEKLGNVVASGIKVLVLAVIVGIGSGLFAEFQAVPDAPSIDHALVVMLAALALLGLGIFGPGIATGLVSGAPQLGPVRPLVPRWASRAWLPWPLVLAAPCWPAPGAARLALGGAQPLAAGMAPGAATAGAAPGGATPRRLARCPRQPARLGQAPATQTAAHPGRHHRRAHPARWRRRCSSSGPQVRDPSNS